jgi:hypothetical protein
MMSLLLKNLLADHLAEEKAECHLEWAEWAECHLEWAECLTWAE